LNFLAEPTECDEGFLWAHRRWGRSVREELLAFVSERGTLLEPGAIEFLLVQQDPIGELEGFFRSCPETPFMVTLEAIRRSAQIAQQAVAGVRTATEPRLVAEIQPIPSSFRRLGEKAEDGHPDVRILRDITGRSTCEGTLEDFTRYFRNRFKVLGDMLRQRRELGGSQDIAKARRSTREVRIIGMVADVRTTKNGHRIVELEDDAECIPVLLPADSPLASEPVVTDEVVGVVGTVNAKGLLIASSLVRPDLPTAKSFPGTRGHGRVAFMSDIHVGSRTFLEDKWAKVSEWLGKDDEIARSIRYLVVSGDVVDGIGVYPRQDEELTIDDIYGQYEALARMIGALPDHLAVILLPGNHDAVRPAEPQPTFPTSIQKLFDSNVTFAGNPSLLALEGVRVLAYHGRSMDDLVSSIPGLSYRKPLDGMKAMLRMRHLAPIYGGKTPIAPEAEDHLIINEVPDIFVTGHVHAVGVDQYRGVVLVNSSTWQAQTPYQKMRNIDPTPACLPIVDLATGQAVIREF
jgi:DNA polymerase II small subunit